MTNRRLKLCAALLLSTGLSTGYAQEAVVAAGNNASGSGGSSSYSVGQVFFTNISGGGGSVGQGVQSIANTNVTLPVEILNFKAVEHDNNSVLLSWQTAWEKDNDVFVLEKGAEGRNFKEFARVTGKGNSGSIISYKTFDYAPGAGTNYYRLKQVDFDGTMTYSPIRIVYIAKGMNELSVFPNPTSDLLILQTNTSDLKNYQIVDISGKVLESKPITSNRMQIDISKLQPAIYIVNIIQENRTIQSFKIIKK